jgi:hypothetical protein
LKLRYLLSACSTASAGVRPASGCSVPGFEPSSWSPGLT